MLLNVKYAHWSGVGGAAHSLNLIFKSITIPKMVKSYYPFDPSGPHCPTPPNQSATTES